MHVCVCFSKTWCIWNSLKVAVLERLLDKVACYSLLKCQHTHTDTISHPLLHPFSSRQLLFLSLTPIWTCLFLPLSTYHCVSAIDFGECVKIQAIVRYRMIQSLHGTVPLGMHLSQTMSLSLLPLYHRKCVSDRECVPIYSDCCIVDECHAARCNSRQVLLYSMSLLL